MNNEINDYHFNPDKPQNLNSKKGVITKVPRELIEKIKKEKNLTNPKKRVLVNPDIPNNRGYVSSTILIVASIILLSIVIFTGIGNMLGK